MEAKQLNTGCMIAEKLFEQGFITMQNYWRIEGALIDIYNGDGTKFLNKSCSEFERKKTVQILYTIGVTL